MPPRRYGRGHGSHSTACFGSLVMFIAWLALISNYAVLFTVEGFIPTLLQVGLGARWHRITLCELGSEGGRQPTLKPGFMPPSRGLGVSRFWTVVDEEATRPIPFLVKDVRSR